MITFENGEFIAAASVPYAKELQAAGWRPRMGIWYTTELDNVAPFIEHLSEDILEVLNQTADALEESLARDTDYVVDLPPGRELMGFQKVDVEYIVKRKDTLLAEDCGTGKTAIMLSVLNMLKDATNVLVVCPAVAKYMWAYECGKWLCRPFTSTVVSSQPSLGFLNCQDSICTFQKQIRNNRFKQRDDVTQSFAMPSVMSPAFGALFGGVGCYHTAETLGEPAHQSNVALPNLKVPVVPSVTFTDTTFTVDDPSHVDQVVFSKLHDRTYAKAAVIGFDSNAGLLRVISDTHIGNVKSSRDLSGAMPLLSHRYENAETFVSLSNLSSGTHVNIIILNFDILPYYKKFIQSITWDCLIVDESHRVNNNDARRTAMILGGNLKLKADKRTGRTKEQIGESYCATQLSPYVFDIPPIKAKKRIFATGTPMNRPKNLWTVIRAFDPYGLGANEDHFHRRYCQRYVNHMGVYDDNGAAHQQELGAYLRSKFMIRHTEAIDLPPQQQRLFLLPPVDIVLTQEKEFIQENLESLIKLGQYMGKTVNEETPVEEFMRIIGEAVIENVKIIGDPVMQVMFTQFAKVREATGLAKVPHIIDYVKLKSDDGNVPIVVFGYHKKVMAALHEAFADWSFVIGGMSAKRRAEEVRRFQEGDTPGFLGNYDAAGESITLTRSNYLIAGEIDWRGTQTLQVFKRIKRFTQTRKSYADILCSAKSFDAIIAERCLEKIRNIELTLDM